MDQLIREYFVAILRREPTQDQIDLWLNLIDPNDPEPGIEDLTDALCFQADEVLSIMRIYQVVLGRVPDPGGLDFWVQVFRDMQDANPGLSYREALVETIRDWLSSDEFVSVYGDNLSDEEYVALLYINVLNRPPDQAGFNFWVNELKSGAITREGLVIAFSESEEFKMMVDAEAKGILLYDAQTSSTDPIDDPDYEIPGNNPYQGELQNEAPVDIQIGTDVDENAADGTVVNEGQLTAVDPDGGETFTWELVDDAGGAFELDDASAQQPNIVVADGSLLDHETDPVMTVRVRVTDSRDNTYEEDVVIDINDINEAPENIQLSNTEIDEQDGPLSGAPPFGAIVGHLAADDADGDPLTYTIVDSTLPGALRIVGNLVEVNDPLLIDSEAGVVTIVLTVRATDPNGKFTLQDIPIGVRAIVDEDPTGVFPEEVAVAATAAAGFEIAPLMAEDPDTSPDSHTFEITHDPTGGAFAVDLTGRKFVLADPQKISSTHITDGGPLDADGVADGYVVVPVEIEATDSGGNKYRDTIHVKVDQSGTIAPFTGATVEVLEGTDGNDIFTANAGRGETGAPPGAGRTANAGDIANGEGGFDRFVLTKQDDSFDDGTSFVSGVRLNDVESILIMNRDISPLPPEETLDLFQYVCTPCIEMPVMAPNSDNPVIFEASLAPDLDHLAFGQSLSSVGVWDLQADFWAKDPLDLNDPGPVVDVFDFTGDFLWVDSDPQAKLAGDPIDEIVFNLDEVLINGLLITENASGNEPGIQRPEQVGAIRLVASGVPSVIGSINNGPGIGGFAAPSITSTLTIVVGDLTGSRPTPDAGPAAAAANTAAIDFFAGQTDGIGDGLLGLENVNIEGGGDVFLVFGSTANDTDSDGDGFPLEIVDGEGSSFFFFEPGGFRGVRIDGGEGFDTVGLHPSALNFGNDDTVTGVERIKVYNGALEHISLHAFDDTTQEIVFAGGVIRDTYIYNIPDIGGTTDQELLCDDFGDTGFVVNIDQCCHDRDPWNDHQIPDRGDLPTGFNLFLDADGTAARVDLILNIDPGNPFFPAPHEGTLVDIRNLQVKEISTFHIRVEDCDDTTDGVFEVRHLGSHEDVLETLLLTDDGNEGTTRILQDPDYHLLQYIFGGLDNPFRSTGNLSLINGVGGVRNQEFLRIEDGDQPPLKFLPVLENWDDDANTNRPGPQGFQTFPGRIVDELVVSDDGAVVNLGEGNDLFTGNRLTADGSPDAAGADVIRGNGGNDLIFGAAGNDQIEGGTGDDELQGEAGDDCIWGNEGDDLLNGGKGADYVDGGADDDIIFGGLADDILRGGEGDDAICGDDGDDCLFGEDGNDLLIGGRGADFLDAGTSGTDALVGDYGCDPCYVHVTIPDGVEECDIFTLGLDRKNDDPVRIAFQVELGGTDGAREFICESEISLSAGGWLEALVDGASYQSLYVGSTEATIDHFVTTWGPAISADTSGYELSRDGNKLVMTAKSPPASVPVVDITPGDVNDTITNTKIEKIYEATATREAVTGAFETLLDQWITGAKPTTASAGDPECWDVFSTGETITICRVGEEPGVTLTGVDAPAPAVHKAVLGAQVGEQDTFKWDVAWDNGGPLNETYIFRYAAADLGTDVSADGIVDTIAELKALAQLIADDFNGVANVDPLNDTAAAKLRDAGFSMEVDADGNICLIGPDDKTGQTPKVEVSAADGDAPDLLPLPQISKIDFGKGTGFLDIGDVVFVDIDGNIVDVEVAGLRSRAEIAAAIVKAINADTGTSAIVEAAIDPADEQCVNLTAKKPGAVGFKASVGVFDDTIDDEKAEVNASGLATGDTLTIDIGPPVFGSYPVAFNTDLATTYADFVATHAGTILSTHDLIAEVESGVLTFTRANGPVDGTPVFAGGDLGSTIAAKTTGAGTAFVSITKVTNHQPSTAPVSSDVQAGIDPVQDNTQSLTDAGQTDGVPPIVLDFGTHVEVEAKTKASQDVFVASARNNDAATFAADAYDNDLMPQQDFMGLLQAAGRTAGTNGSDGGVEGVVYVLDFNQGSGGDDPTTWHYNEAFDKSLNTDAGSATGIALKNAFDGDTDRVEGDKLAFRKFDGELDQCGSALNYAEAENVAASRDDADANAAAAFGSEGLRYYVNARTFEDALLNDHGVRWGIDVDQADVDTALADLADGFDANDVGGPWLSSLHLIETMTAAKSESWLRVYYNEAGTDAAPEAVMELVGLDSKTQMSFTDIVGADCIDDCDVTKDPADICDPFIL